MSAEQVTQSIQELEALRKRTRIWRSGSALAVVVIAAGSALCLIGAVRDLVRPGLPRDEFVKEFQAGFTEEVVPQIKVEAQKAVEELTPVVRAELAKLDLQSPKMVEGVQKELEALKENLPNRAEQVMDSTIGDMLRIREAKIKKLHPDLTDEKMAALMDNLVEEGQTRVVKVIDDMFKPQQDTFDKIVEHLREIQKIEGPNIKEEKPTFDMALLFFELIKEDFEGLSSEDLTEALKQTASEVVK